jgi:hypothetical protein
MSERLRNNLIAGLIVFAFWCISFSAIAADPIVSESTQVITSNSKNETTVKSPPPSAIASQITSSSSDFLCTVSASGAIQTQILGISLGGMHTDDNCELLQKSHALYNMGMKVAAIAVLCNDPVIHAAMANSSTFCPYKGLLGLDAKSAWEANQQDIPKELNEPTKEDKTISYLKIIGGIAGAFLFF